MASRFEKQSIGDVVANSMMEILDSDEHQWLFGKTAAKKKCCACDKKCARKCPCKLNNGCKKSCDSCEAIAKKASDEKKKCCDCMTSCGEKCACASGDKGDCSNCSMCSDGVKTAANHEDAVEMMSLLLELSERQEKLGMNISAEMSLKLAELTVAEFKKVAQLPMDENDVTALDLFSEEPDEFIESGESDTPNVDDIIQDLLEKHPEFVDQLRRRMRDSEPIGNELESIDDILGPDSFSKTMPLNHPPPGAGNLPTIPGMGPTPPSESQLSRMIDEETAAGKDHRYLMYGKDTGDGLSEDERNAIEEARSELAKNYPGKDKITDHDAVTIATIDQIDKLATKFAQMSEDFEDEDDGKVSLDTIFPDSASVDDMINDVLHTNDDEDDDDIELAFAAKDMSEKMSHWYSGQGDPLYGVTSLFYAGKTPELDNVAQARDIVESLFNKQLNGDTLDMDAANELAEIHTFLVDYLKAKGYSEPGEYLDAGVTDEEDEDSLMDTYMELLSGPNEGDYV